MFIKLFHYKKVYQLRTIEICVVIHEEKERLSTRWYIIPLMIFFIIWICFEILDTEGNEFFLK